MSEFLWQWFKEENKRIKEVGMLEWIYYIRPENPAYVNVALERQETHQVPRP